MLKFEPISIKDKSRLSDILGCKNCIHTESSFNVLFTWGEVFNTQVAYENSLAFIKSTAGGVDFYQMPWGNNDLRLAIETIYTDAKARGDILRLTSVTECMKDRLEKMLPGAFEFCENRDIFDYVYSSEDMITLAGRSFHQKRNNINKFNKLFEGRWEYSPISENDLDEVYAFQLQWLEKNSTEEKKNSLTDEMKVIRRIFDNYTELGYSGGMIRVDGKICAYTVGSKVRDNAMIISLEKADVDYPGIYQVINREFAEKNCGDIEYINREDDAGSEGLRRAKLSYNPKLLIKKYIAECKSL